MPLLSLAEVASRTGMARSSIYRLIDEGKLSATLDHRGRKAVELTEVLRFFGAITNETTGKDTSPDTSNNPVIQARHITGAGQDTLVSLMQELAQARSALEFKAKELELKDRELAMMQSRVDELKATHEQATTEKNRFLEIIERQSLLLAAPKPVRTRTPAAKKVAAPTKPKAVTKKAVATVKPEATVKKAATPAKPKSTEKKTTATAAKNAKKTTRKK